MKKTSKSKKLLALFLGWIGAGIIWAGWTAIFGETSNENSILIVIQLFIAIFVWVKIYFYFVRKWAI